MLNGKCESKKERDNPALYTRYNSGIDQQSAVIEEIGSIAIVAIIVITIAVVTII
jgi:hypothetical protein